MVAAVAGGVMTTSPAAAQDPTTVELTVEQSALYSHPVNDAIPNTLVSQFPPFVFCLLFPEPCNEQTAVIRDPLTGIVQEIDQNEQTVPVQPVAPSELTVSYLGGNARYQSAVRFALPTIPSGEEVDQAIVRFAEGQPSFAFDSPLFQAAAADAIVFAGSQDPTVFFERLADTLASQAPISEPLLGIEACPLTKPMADAEAPQSAPATELNEPGPDGDPQPAVDCLYGASGVYEDGVWSFDLTFALIAWQDGTLENHGILLRPTGAPNLAFGDADTSTNSQVTLTASSEAPTMELATSPPPTPPTIPPPAQNPPPSQPDTTSTPSTPSSNNAPPSSTLFSTPTPTTTATTVGSSQPSSPTVADPVAQPQPTVAIEPVAVPGPESPWYLWLLIPAFLLGAWMTTRSLNEELVIGQQRSGALTRLVAANTSTS